MELEDPISAYNAGSNLEAIQVAEYLQSQGLAAHAAQDESVVGLWFFGTLPEIHKPQVWVSRADQEAAARLLSEYEAHRREINPRHSPPRGDGGDITAMCEECSTTSSFALALNGTVQRCPKCYAHMDVGEFDWPSEDFGDPEDT